MAYASAQRTVILAALVAVALLPGCPRRTPPSTIPTPDDFDEQLPALLISESVGGIALGDFLSDLQIEGCLEAEQVELSPALGRLRSLHRRTYEHASRSGKLRVWRSWEAQLLRFSPDGRALVEAWLDQPELARHLYLCEDGLPSAWRALEAAGFRDRALTWFDAEVEARRAQLGEGGADGASGIEELWELKRRIERRFDAQFGDRGQQGEVRTALLADLDLLWEAKVEPHDSGRPVLYVPAGPEPTPREVLQAERVTEPATYSDHPRAAGSGARRYAPGFVPPDAGGISFSIPDPRDVAEAQRVRRSWWRTRRAVMDEVRALEDRLDELEVALDGADGPERDRLLAELDRLALDMDHAYVDLSRHRDYVQHYRTGRAGSDVIVRKYKRREVRRTGRRQERVAEDHAEVVTVAERVEAAGGGGGGGGGGGSHGGGGASAAIVEGVGGTDGGSEPAGLPAGGEPVVDEPGEGGTLVYEGPCPSPGDHWSAEVVGALLADHPFLDEVDARIFLTLLHRTWPGLGSVEEVEALVLDRLARGVDLRLRSGRAGDLSGQYDPSLPDEQQEVIVFYVWLGS